jgi:membrane-bound metal-dependent hydrolase YbcI (DUF457 family)
MLAVNHVSLATASILVISVYSGIPFFLPLLLLVAVGALIPDIDHSGSTLGEKAPVVGHLVSHRGPTHSFLFLASVYFGLTFLLGSNNTILKIVLSALSLITIRLIRTNFSFEQRSFGIFNHNKTLKNISLIFYSIWPIIALVFIWTNRFDEQMLQLFTAGVGLHIIGDILTKDGVKLFWPLDYSIGLGLFKTGSFVEKMIGVLLFLLNIYLLYLFCVKYNVITPQYWEGKLGVFLNN